MNKYQPHIGDKAVGYLFKNKIHFAISFIIWSIIYKIIDMNTLQWFGRDIFVDGNVLGFFVASAFAFCLLGFIVGSILNLFIGE